MIYCTFKSETRQVVKEGIGVCPRSRSGFGSENMLEIIKENCAARLTGNLDYYGAPEERQGEVCCKFC